MVCVKYHSDLKEVQSDQRLSELLSSSRQHAPFDRLGWWQALAAHCDIAPLLAVARHGDATAVLPLAREGGHLVSLANWYTFRFRPIVSHDHDRAALLGAIAADLRHKAHRVTLSGIPGEDGSAAALEAAFRDAGWFVNRETCDTNHVLPVNGRSYEEFLAGRPGRLRTTLRRKAPKVATQVLTRFDPQVWAAYEEIYRESWKPEEGSPAFLRAFAAAEGEAGRLRLAIAHAVDDSARSWPIAAQMWTVEGGCAYIHKLAHREDARPLSPGSVLSAHLFRHVIDEDGVALVDFGTGNDGYKADWMEEVRPRYRLDMFRPFAARNWLIFAKFGLQRLAGRHNQS